MQTDEHDYASTAQHARAQDLALVAIVGREHVRRLDALLEAERALSLALDSAQRARADLEAATELLRQAITVFDR